MTAALQNLASGRAPVRIDQDRKARTPLPPLTHRLIGIGIGSESGGRIAQDARRDGRNRKIAG